MIDVGEKPETLEVGTPRLGFFKKLIMATVAVVLILLMIEGAASVLLSWREAAKDEKHLAEEKHCVYDADLGWANERSRRVENLFGPGKHLTINAAGFRSTREYTAEVPAGKYRVVFLGDSFTEGYGVGDAESFPAQVEALAPGVEAVNMGLGGYGLGQCYLWYRRDGVRLESNIVVFAFIANNFHRLMNDQFMGYPKPLLRMSDGKLEVDNVPVPEGWGEGVTEGGVDTRRLAIGQVMAKLRSAMGTSSATEARALSDQTYRAGVDTPCPDMARAVFRSLRDLCRERGQALVLAYLPARYTVHLEPTFAAVWAKEAAAREGIPFIDLWDTISTVPLGSLNTYFRRQDHYTAEGNQLVAKTMLAFLRERFPDVPR